MSQYIFNISPAPSYGAHQFVVSKSNEVAHAWVLRWPDWPNNALYLQGEAGSGKTHLAHLWKEKSSAQFLEKNSDVLPNIATIIDNIEEWENEAALFHLYNHCKSEGVPLLVTSSRLPVALNFTLPDLCSRLKSMTMAAIEPPDDALMQAALIKQLADLQLKVDPSIVEFMLPRMERSFAILSRVVRQLDEASLKEARTLTIPFIKQTLGW